MSFRLSIIIPTLNAADALPETLDCLLPGVAAGVIREVIVSDGGSADATLEIADDAGAVIVRGAAGRGGQLRRGAALARADWLLFVHADTHLPPDWVGALAVHAQQHPGDAAAFRLKFRARGLAPRLVAGWANLRSRAFGLPYGDQGLLIPAAVYAETGGFPDQPLMEDVALARALRGRLRLLPARVETGAERYLAGGWLRRGARNLWLLLRYLGGADPSDLAKAYHKS
ncbi:MAG: TIGR04283 family arsenosugar biosynthesis glycosyltransferase [Paracoccaceae bacterium]